MAFEITAGRLLLDEDGVVFLRINDGPDAEWAKLGPIDSDPEAPPDSMSDLAFLRSEWQEHLSWDARSEVIDAFLLAKGVR